MSWYLHNAGDLQFAQHNFADNFFAAVGYNDDEMLEDIMLDEIARLIADHSDRIINVLKMSGVATKKKPTDKELIHLIAQNLNKNEGLQKNITKLIIGGYIDPMADVFYSGGDAEKEKAGTKAGQILSNPKVAKKVAVIMPDLFGTLDSEKRKEREELVLDKIQNQNTNYKPKKQKVQVKWFWVVGGLVAAGVLAYVFYNLMKAKETPTEGEAQGQAPLNPVTPNLATGGQVDGMMANPAAIEAANASSLTATPQPTMIQQPSMTSYE